ncbi:MAG: DUF1549 domain-containing protein [Gemmataceae bacterium]
MTRSRCLQIWASSAVTCVVALLAPSFGLAAPPQAPMPRASADIDALLADHWRTDGVKPSSVADDATLFRRLMLDLTGRVPTVKEVEAFASDRSPEKYATAVRRLVVGPEFEWYFANVLDEMIQGRFAGGEPFVGYLRRSLREEKGWDTLFREMMLGPWDTDTRKPAVGFLDRRAKDIDVLTVDVARTFFGVDISCARCHNHPLVRDWKRDHYYGRAAFLIRTTGAKGSITETPDGEAKFAGKDGKERIAPMMFLSGRVLEQPAKPASMNRRDALVRVALEEKVFLSRAFVNRVWDYFHGRGLVSPVDQMHSANPASMPSLLDALAEDFATHGYDIRRLVTMIVSSRAYRLDGRWVAGGEVPNSGHFAVSRLRPLSARQLARSLVLVVGDGNFDGSPEKLAALDKQALELMPTLDPRTADFQSSTREALFVSNSEAVRKLIAASGNLAERLAASKDDGEVVKTAVRTVNSRTATESEVADLTAWLKKQSDRRAVCEDLVWALVSSAEFRFNH